MDSKKLANWEILETSEKINVDKLLPLLLKNRGIKTKKELEEFLTPTLKNLTAEKVGINKPELTKALSRISKALKEKQEIIVFGDYDVDGITGAAILWETLHSIDAKVLPYIPHRFDEGYGLSIKAIDNILKTKPETKLIITVDNGIVAQEAVGYAKKNGLDVIVTDHHLPETKKNIVKNAIATVHTTLLCGSAVGYVLSREIKSKIAKEKYDFEKDDHLELAALGTIADMVPLTHANRVVAHFGIQKLKETKRPGLLALYNEAGIERQDVSDSKIGHVIAPRINATGRLNSGMDSLRLICTKDKKRAQELAATLGRINRERQIILTSSVVHAIDLVVSSGFDQKKIIIIAHEEYQEGVIGLVAGRLVEKFYRPSIVISKRDGQSKASVRSVSGFNIIEFLRLHKKHFVNVGGHPMAAGFTVETVNIGPLTLALEEASDAHITEEMLTRRVKIDCILDSNLISETLYQELMKLEPFGVGNPTPVFLSKKVKVNNFRTMGENGKHLKISLGDERIIDAVGFGMGERSIELKEGGLVDVVYTIDENVWNGNKKLQLKVRDFRVS